jgi:hypothetical protein
MQKYGVVAAAVTLTIKCLQLAAYAYISVTGVGNNDRISMLRLSLFHNWNPEVN